MQHPNKFLFLASVMLFFSVFVASASTVSFLSQNWSFSALGPGAISQNALDSIGQIAYFGSSVTIGYTNYLYAVNITNGQEIWQYNTSLPVNYVSNFTYNNSPYIIAGTGYPLGSPAIPSKSYVLAFPLQSNVTLWNSSFQGSSVISLGSAESSIHSDENVIAGLENGTVVCLSGLTGSVLWQQNCSGSVFSVVGLQDGSVAVGSLNYNTGAGQVYRFNGTDGTLFWSYPKSAISGYRLTLIRKFADVNGEPELIAVFNDGLIHVLNGTTGLDVGSPCFFNVSQQVANGDNVKDLLCTQDYTGDGFPDIVACTDFGYLIMIDGRTGALTHPPLLVGNLTTTYVQYLYSFENGFSYLNKTLAVSLENLTASTAVPYICGVNASNLSIMGQIPVPGGVVPRNLFSVGNYSSPYTGDLLFTANNVVYLLSGIAAPLQITIFPLKATTDVGLTVKLNASASGGTTPYTYQWYINGSSAKGAVSSSFQFSPTSPATYNIYATVQDSSGSNATSNTTAITVNNSTLVTKFSITPLSSSMLYSNNEASASLSASEGSGPYTYDWYLNGVNVENTTSPSYTYVFRNMGQQRMQVKVTDSAGYVVESNVLSTNYSYNYVLFVLLAVLIVAVISGLIFVLRKRMSKPSPPKT